jgi:hypothetical protein
MTLIIGSGSYSTPIRRLRVDFTARVSPHLMPVSLTRRQALKGGAVLALWGALTAPRRALAREAGVAGTVDVTVPVPARMFSRRTGSGFATPPLRAGRRLDLIGLRWSSPGDPRLELRVRRRGRWGSWIPLPEATDHRPDAGTREAARGAPRPGPAGASEAVAVGGARVFQLRAARPVHGLLAHGVAVSRPLAASAARRPARAQPAAPAVIARSQWGAQAPRSAPDYGEVQLAFVHHTVTANDYSIDESASIVRGVQHYHRNVLGWNDIGYNLLVDRYGQVFEGRAGGIDQAVMGAQAQGYNSTSTGIAVIGTHTSQAITTAAFEALASVLAWKLSLHALPAEGEVTVISTGGPLNRYPAGTPVQLFRISGHRDGDETECPGGALYGRLPALRVRAAHLAGQFPTTGLLLSVSPRRVGYLQPATVSGTLLLPDGSPRAGVAVDVQARSASGWSSVASAVTDPAGAWSTTLALPYSRSLRAVTAAPVTPIRSGTIRLEVRSAVTPRIRPVRLRLGRGTLVSGRVEPVKRRQRLVATIERRLTGGRYVRVARLPVTARSGRFRLALRPPRPGLYRVRLSVPGDRLNVPTRSGFVFARVRG